MKASAVIRQQLLIRPVNDAQTIPNGIRIFRPQPVSLIEVSRSQDPYPELWRRQ
jgi:hypothetical protein